MSLFLRLKKRLFAISFLWLFFLFLEFFSDNAHATTPTLTLIITNSIASLNIIPSSTNGTFASSSSDISFTVNTNNYTGYTLGITASSNDINAANLTQDVTEGGNTTTYAISSIGTVSGVTSSGITESTFSTSSNTQYNNTWGMKPSKLNSSSNSNYLPAPTSTSNTITIDTTMAANTNNVANSYTIGIGARIDNDLPPGAYTNTFVVTAVARALTYSITYDANDGNNGNDTTDMPQIKSVTSVVNPNTSPNYAITLASAPSRDGYNFLGWCTAQVADGAACSGTEYQAGGNYEINYASSNVFTLYARWEEAGIKLYDTVAAMSKGTQTAAELQAEITVPTSSDPSQDTSNSGVYEYDASVFGTSSDASNDYKIYYYRGVLDSNLDGTNSTYGSNGDGAYYPNYVRLGDTCWRIVRTTGSGGVKMIYNGLYSSINSCAHATINAQVTHQAFGLEGNSAQSTWSYNINRVGYTFNNSSDIQDITTATSVDTVFGSDANPSLNNARSNIKTYIEDTWYTSTNGISAYTSILEASAGYCNDRTAYSNTNTSTALTTIPPYRTSSFGQTMYFGAYVRNMDSAKTPSLTCPRGTVDLYRYVANSAGLSNELKYPVALLTADEASFAGSGSSTATNGSASNYSSYLRSGSFFWLLSPYSRSSKGGASEFILGSPGLDYIGVGAEFGVRPAISLKSGTTATSGSGTATDPWVVTAP